MPKLAGPGTRSFAGPSPRDRGRLSPLRTRPQPRRSPKRRLFQRPAFRGEYPVSADRSGPLGIDGFVARNSGGLGPDLRGSGAVVSVESGFRDLRVIPSQGSHFFQNLTAFQIGYFTVNPDAGEGFVDWQWLAEQPAVEEHGCVRHLQFAAPLVVVMNGKTGEGMIFKPDTTP